MPMTSFDGLQWARNIRNNLSPLQADHTFIWAMQCMKNLQQFHVMFATDCFKLVKIVYEHENGLLLLLISKKYNGSQKVSQLSQSRMYPGLKTQRHIAQHAVLTINHDPICLHRHGVPSLVYRVLIESIYADNKIRRRWNCIYYLLYLKPISIIQSIMVFQINKILQFDSLQIFIDCTCCTSYLTI